MDSNDILRQMEEAGKIRPTEEMVPVLLGDHPRFAEIGHGFNMYNALQGKAKMWKQEGRMGSRTVDEGFYIELQKQQLFKINNALADRSHAPEEINALVEEWVDQAKKVETAWFESDEGETGFESRTPKEHLPVTHDDILHYEAIYAAIDHEVYRGAHYGTGKPGAEADLDTFRKIMDGVFRGDQVTEDDRRTLDELKTKYEVK